MKDKKVKEDSISTNSRRVRKTRKKLNKPPFKKYSYKVLSTEYETNKTPKEFITHMKELKGVELRQIGSTNAFEVVSQ